MLENGRLSGSIEQIGLGFLEREATLEFLMKLSIQLQMSELLLSNTVRVCEIFGVQRARSTVHNWVHKADLQPEAGKNPDHVAVDETMIQLNDEQYWLYAAVDAETNELLYTTLEPSRNTMIAQQFLTEIGEKHDVSEAVFLIDGAQSLQAACHRAGYDFRYEKHGNRNAVERVFREIKHRTVCFSNCFSNASAETADDWIRSLSFVESAYLNTTTDLVESFTQGDYGAGIALHEVENLQAFGIADVDEDGNVTELIEKPDEPPTNLALIGIYVFSNAVFDVIEQLEPSWRGELELVAELMADVDAVVNFAAESHVDRSIDGAESFVSTNVQATQVLLDAALEADIDRFLQISTDEVYGQIIDGTFSENDELNPRNPYAATKASADLLAQSYGKTHRLPVAITRTCNNFGPRQHSEKLIPKFIQNAAAGKELPVYGDGSNVREWIYVEDNCRALDVILREGNAGEVYNIGSGEERTNLEVTEAILDAVGGFGDQITFVEDRAGHDQRYALEFDKLTRLGWEPSWSFEEGLEQAVDYYL